MSNINAFLTIIRKKTEVKGKIIEFPGNLKPRKAFLSRDLKGE